MKILLIEDDDIKAIDIEKFLQKDMLCESIVRKHSWQSGLLEILDNMIYDFVLLDMSMPRYDSDYGITNEEFEPFAGWELLSEIQRKKINASICVITAFDVFGKDDNKITSEELDVKLAEKFPDLYHGMVLFSRSSVDWKNKLQKILSGE